MATEIPPRPDYEPNVAAQPVEKTGPTRSDRAKAAFAAQKTNAKARTVEWLRTGDVTDEDLIEEAMRQREKERSQDAAQIERRLAQVRVQLNQIRNIAKHDSGDHSRSIAHLAGEQAQLESLLQAVRRQVPAPIGDREIDSARAKKKAARLATAAGAAVAALPVTSTAVEAAASGQPMLLAALGAGFGYGWYLVSRPFDAGQPAPAPTEQLAAPVDLTKPEPVPGQRVFNAPPPPACTVPQLEEALRKIGMMKGDEQLAVLAVPQREKDGNTTVVFDLPAGQTVAKLQDKIEEFAGGLGRDSTMVDIEKKGSAVRTSLWIADSDPFEETRPSPLIKKSGPIDAFKDGVPVGWGKRGNTIYLPIRDSNFIIGGGTRSGKGVGAANLVAGSTLDIRINHRIVAGKNNGEWDPYAKAGVAGTYFKPDPHRLLALLHAMIADKNRREAELGRLGKSKLVAQAIEGLGGLELLVIDELATYTRPDRPLRDEILEALIELSAVAAGAGMLMALITQHPSTDVIPTALAVNCTTKWAMRVDTADQSNAILGKGSSGMGRDASKFDPPRPGLGWLINPFVGVTDKARSFDLDQDEREEVTLINERAAKLREQHSRLAGQWEDPIERHLLNATGLSSAAGGPRRDGIPGRNVLNHTPEQRMQMDALRGCLAAMDVLGRDVAQLDEMAQIIGGGMAKERLGDLLRAGGAGGVTKIVIEGRGRTTGYERADIADALKLLEGQ
ncbi:S-DNA-T family DNA segregation ATPase FtsK/SpoIIIE [Streptomyces sp. SAI-119]|uniref:hypothetical protein n=1 Tax=Streptomyces sp. SAI-119 TaxID=2940541 RepID=UPI002476BEE1|nr:hypothetical protein [Streptomyces sp. SAI-119]MDH6448211.1 S-DNA-T family DNA segregation ATPase FtsK/SpoIIIE [Streptomyces sp. SAI-119]